MEIIKFCFHTFFVLTKRTKSISLLFILVLYVELNYNVPSHEGRNYLMTIITYNDQCGKEDNDE